MSWRPSQEGAAGLGEIKERYESKELTEEMINYFGDSLSKFGLSAEVLRKLAEQKRPTINLKLEEIKNIIEKIQNIHGKTTEKTSQGG